MSTLKQLRLRIAGVKSTQKITKTMKMVAASKLLKSQHQRDNSKPYADKLNHIMSQLIGSVSFDSSVPNLLTGNGKDEMHLVVAVSSDRGLCGAFNSSIAKNLKRHLQFLKAQNKQFKIICLGKKIFDLIKVEYRDQIIEVLHGYSSKKFSYSDACELAVKIRVMFEQEEFDQCYFIYNEFKNVLKQEVRLKRLIPIGHEGDISAKTHYVYDFEPMEEKVLEQLLPLNLASQIYYILLESVASEHGARMTAMDSATTNANDMISKLTLKYNRSRQASITRELIEIISSAEVV